MEASIAVQILFPLGGPRLLSILALSAFVALAISRHDRKPVYACLAWMFGFEALFEATTLALGRPEVNTLHVLFYVALGGLVVPLTARTGVTVSWPLLGLALTVWTVWVAIGFPINEHPNVMRGHFPFNPAAEVLNEGMKLAWAAAYLWPLTGRRSARLERAVLLLRRV